MANSVDDPEPMGALEPFMEGLPSSEAAVAYPKQQLVDLIPANANANADPGRMPVLEIFAVGA